MAIMQSHKSCSEKYPAYKDSGVEWLGEIPEGWEVNRLKSRITLLTGYPFKSEKYTNKGVKLARGINVKEGYFDWTELRCWPEITRELDFFLLKEGDVLISMDGSKVGKNFCQVKQSDLPVLLLQRVARLRTKKGLTANFLYWNIVCKSFLSWVNMSKTDPMVPHIAPKDINNFVIALPSESEQTAIANFLDDKTAKIDRAIAQKEQLIALLKERKQIIIQDLVTGKKVWNEDKKAWTEPVEVKDSGIGWIGEIPEGWGIGKLGHFSRINNGTTPSRANPRYWTNGTVAWLSSGKVNESVVREPSEYITERAVKDCSLKVFPKLTVIMGIVGQGKTRGTCSILSIEATINQNMVGIVTNSKLNPFFLHYFLIQGYRSIRNGNGSNQEALNCDIIKNLKLPLPNKLEQMNIVQHIETQSAKIDQAIALLLTQIEKLKEFKATLIDSAVTGKLRVPSVQEIKVS